MTDEINFTTLQRYVDENDQRGARAYLHGLLNDNDLTKEAQAKVHCWLGRTAYYGKDAADAKRHFLNALRLEPGNLYATFYLALIAQQAQNPVTSLGLYLSCLRTTEQNDALPILSENIVSRLESFQFEDEEIAALLAEHRQKKNRRLFATALPKISILMLCYNKVQYTEQCVNALFANTDYPNFELIVVDNASTDDTPAFLETFGEKITFVRSESNLGFVKGNNLAARHAKGDFLVFLNNDTEVQKEWLSALLKIFALYPDAGAVGSMLIYPDGRLQEAGGAVFQDASGWNYGRGGNPADGRYRFVREVDYCSGASLMVRKDLFDRLGGFDERFAPAYYEDTDLCFAVRKLGFKVYYCPDSQVIHHEGATAGTDLGSGFKKYQVVNKNKFLDKWKAELSLQHPNDPELAYWFSNRKKGKRILIIDDCPPLPDKASGSLKIYRTVRQMLSLGYQVTFVHLMGKGTETSSYLSELRTLGVELIWFRFEEWWNKRNTPEADRIRRNLIAGLELKKRNYDFIYIAFWWVAAFFMDPIRKEIPDCPLLVDSVDLHYLRERRQAELAQDKKALRKAMETEKAELEVYSKADAVSVVSEIEVNELRKRLPDKAVFIISNTHDPEETRNGFEERKDFLFVGSFNHPPNQDAVLFFAQEVFPLIKKELPDAKFYVVGNNPTDPVKQLAGEDIIVTGWVPFTQPYLEQCRVSVIPLRYGAGVKGKVGETLSYGLPMVSTTIGVEAMYIRNEEHAFVADDPQKFADYCVRLYREKATWEQFSKKGKEIIERRFSTRTALRRIKYITGFETREAFRSRDAVLHEDAPEDLVVDVKSERLDPLFHADKDGILFAGDFSHPQYCEGLEFLLKDIVPRIQDEMPGFKLYIAGKEAGPKAKGSLCDAVIAVESKDDVAACIAKAKMLLLPITNPVGIEESIREALSWNIPAIVTSCVANHFGLIDGKEIIVADTDESFAANVVKLQNSTSLWGTLFVNGLDPAYRKKTSVIEQEPQKSPSRKARTKNIVSIVILTMNQLEYTKECVKSIEQNTPQPHEIIFIDNASTDGTVKWLRELITQNPNYRLFENAVNFGFAKGCNQGIEASSGEYVLLLNNDVVVTKDWLAGLLECVKSAPDIGIVGPMTNNISGPQKVPVVGYTDVRGLDDYAAAFRAKNRHRKIAFRRIVGFCMLFRRDLADTVGMLDESFGTGNFEDDDYCLRADLLGYRNVIAGDVFIHHYGSRSFVGNRINYASVMTGNRKYFTRKWSNIDAESEVGKRLASVNDRDKALDFDHEGKLEQAVSALLDGIKRTPEARPLYYMLAEMLLNAKQFNEALNVLTELLPDDDDERRLALAGYCAEGLGQDDLAERFALRAFGLNRASALTLNLLGVLAYKKKDPQAAQAWFEKATALDPAYADPWTNLGILMWSSGEDKREALEYLERGFILSPMVNDNRSAFYTAATEAGELARLQHDLREARALFPLNRALFFLTLDSLVKAGQFTAAMEEVEQAMVFFGMDDDILSAALEIRNTLGPLQISSDGKRNGTLSLCMITKNEEKNLLKCLMSVKTLADEIIVVDTGSSDRTKDIARALGAVVIDFAWSGDFAAARNASLDKASGDWILVLDADEVISALDYDKIKKIVSKKGNKKAAYSLLTRNYVKETSIAGWVSNDGTYASEEAGTGWSGSVKVRLFPRDSRIRFVNPVHELVEPTLKELGMPVQKSDVIIHHYGKLDARKGVEKAEEYYDLGKKKLAETGETVDALKELAIQAGELGKIEEALDLWNRLVQLEPGMAAAYMNISSLYLKLDRYPDALEAARKAATLAPKMKEAIYGAALCDLYAGNPHDAATVLDALLRREPNYPPAQVLRAMAYCCNGGKERGIKLLAQLRSGNFDVAGSLFLAIKKLVTAGQPACASLLLEAARESGNMNDEILKLELESRRQTV